MTIPSSWRSPAPSSTASTSTGAERCCSAGNRHEDPAEVMLRRAVRTVAVSVLLLAAAGCRGRHGPRSGPGPTSGAPGGLPLHRVADVVMPGPAGRFDYQDVDVEHRRLYVAHLGANRV